MRVFIGESNHVIRKAAEQIPELEIAGSTDSTLNLLENMANAGVPDVLIASIHIAHYEKLLELLKETKMALPDLKIVFVTENLNLASANNRQAVDWLRNLHIDIIEGYASVENLCQILGISREPQFDFSFTDSAPAAQPEQELPEKQEPVSQPEKAPAAPAPVPVEPNQEKQEDFAKQEPDAEPAPSEPKPEPKPEPESKPAEAPQPKKKRNNLFMISSPKAGSGKSFASSNLAYLLAVYGRPKKNSNDRPTVMLVDGDLQTLSVGTLLGIEDDEHNLKHVLQKISSIVDSSGKVKGTPEQKEDVQKFIAESCLLVDDKIPNFYTMVSSTFSLAEREKVSPYHYYYLVQTLMNMFDIVLVDSNSASEHKTTGPTMQIARKILMVVTADYEGIRVAQKMENDLMSVGVSGKTGYVLNKCITKSQLARSDETPAFHPEEYLDPHRIVARIPYVDQIVQYNRIYEKAPLVLDHGPDTLLARIAFTQLAGTIWPMDNYDLLAQEVQELQRKI